jgi:predicted metal-binding protein
MNLKTNKLVNKALVIGFTKAVWLEGLKLECEARLREYCNPANCPNHGNNWVCPPGCGSLEECSEKAGRFDRGLLLQSVSELDPLFADYKGLNREHNLRLKKLIEILGNEWDILALTSGGCVFCDTCAYPAPCLKPDSRMNSLSAFGIDAGKLCKRAGLEYSFRPDRVYFVALVLMAYMGDELSD